MQQERYSDAPVTLYRATRLVLSDWNRKRPLLKRHSWMVLSLGSDSNKAPALFSSISSISMPCTVAAVASAGIFQKFIHQIHVVHNISVFGLSPVKHSMYQDQKAWDITRSTEVLVNLSANKLSPRKSIGENCLSCG